MVCPNTKGFTLVELIMVMIIMGILSIVVTTRVIETTALNQDINISTIRDHIRYASDYALAKGIKTVVSFDVGANQYSLFEEDLAGRTILINPEDNQNFVITLGSGQFKGIDLTNIDVNGTNELKFASYGVPLDANDSKLTSPSFVEINSVNAITIFPVSGLCKVIE